MQKLDTSRVSQRLRDLHMRKYDLAAPLGTTPQNVSFKLNGTVKLSVEELKILCDILKIDTGEVFDFFVVSDD
mgnify:CR=1 FL=1